MAKQLASRVEDQNDQNIPHMIWFGIEPMIMKNPDLAIDLAASSAIPKINQFIARRLVDCGKIDALIDALPEQKKTATNFLQGMLAALEGRTDVKMPENWKNTYRNLQKESQEIKELSDQVNQLFGDQEVIRKLLSDLKNEKINDLDKIPAIKQLALRQQPVLAEQLPDLLANKALQNEAIKAIAQYDRENLGNLLVSTYDQFDAVNKGEVIQTLSSRPRYGWLLTKALSANKIPKKDVPAYMARQLRRVVGSGFVEVWGPIDEPEANLAQSYRRYRNLVENATEKKLDLQLGKNLFTQTCGPCHKLHGEGGIIGPDITGSNRTNLDYLLGNILEPSTEIQDDYKMMVVTTRDGRTYSGNKVAESDRQITMRIVGQDDVILNKTEIQSSETTPVSMMPQGLLKSLSDQEVIDLMGYLMRSESI